MPGLRPEVLLRRLEMLRDGKTNAEIARAEGLKPAAIALWVWRYQKRNGKVEGVPRPPEGLAATSFNWKQQCEAAQREVRLLRDELAKLANLARDAIMESKHRYQTVLVDLRLGRGLPPTHLPTPPPPPPPTPRNDHHDKPAALKGHLRPLELELLRRIRAAGGTLQQGGPELADLNTLRMRQMATRLKHRGLIRIVVNFTDTKTTRYELVNQAP